jgi:hypothetical protein
MMTSRRTTLSTALLLLSSGLIACKSGSSDSKTKGTETAKAVEGGGGAAAPAVDTKPATPAPLVAPEVKVGAGEALAEMGDGIHESPNPLMWKTDAGTIALATIVKGDHALLRAYVGADAVDLTPAIDASSDMTYFITAAPGGTVHFRARALAGRAAGVGALFAFDDYQIAWDAAARKPVAAQHWTCDETDAKGGECDGPAWTEDEAAQPASPPPLPGVCDKMVTDSAHTADAVEDIDGDGASDAVVSALPGDKGAAACDKSDYSCPQTIFIRRGDCGYDAGTLPGNFDKVKVATTRTNGWADLVLDGPDGTSTFVFNGAKYVAKK